MPIKQKISYTQPFVYLCRRDEQPYQRRYLDGKEAYEKCVLLFIVMEIQIKITVTYFTLVRMTHTQKSGNYEC